MARPGNIEKLPKWARMYIERLEGDNRMLRRDLDVIRHGREPGPIQIGHVAATLLDGPGRNEPFYMPGHDVRIEHAGVRLDVSCALGTDRSQPELRLYMDPLNHIESDQVVLIPQASNAVRLTALPRNKLS